MNLNKQRAVSIFLFLGGILVLLAAWDLPESPSPHVKWKADPIFKVAVP